MSPEEWAFKLGEIIREAEGETGFILSAAAGEDDLALVKFDPETGMNIEIPLDL